MARKFRTAVFLLALAAVLSWHPLSVSAQTSDLKTAHGLMQSGKYAEAVVLFQKAVAGPAKNNALAHYYLATCLMQLGKTADARAQYKITLSLNPPPVIASYCHRALGTQPNSTPASSGGTTATTAETSAVAATSTTASLKIDPADKDFVTIHRKTPDSDKIYNTVMNALSVVPKAIKDDIKGGGCKILVCPTILEANPHLNQTRPEGYLHGGGYDNCPGMFYSGTKILYIAERAQWKNSPPRLNWMAASTTLHELGHAYDFCKGNMSSGSEFEKLYKEDYGRLSVSQKNEHQYYCQEDGGERGRAELFAELFAVSHGTAGGIDRSSGQLAAAFPNCYKFIKGLAH